jgi:hypothetical protein
MTDQDKGSQATPDDICNGALKHYKELSDRAKDWLSTIPMAIETHRKYLKGECFASAEEIEKIIDDHIWAKRGDSDKFFLRRMDKRRLAKALSSIPRQLASKEDIEKEVNGQISDIVKIAYCATDMDMTEVYRNFWQLKTTLADRLSSALVGKIPRQMATREEILKIIQYVSWKGGRSVYEHYNIGYSPYHGLLADALLGHIPKPELEGTIEVRNCPKCGTEMIGEMLRVKLEPIPKIEGEQFPYCAKNCKVIKELGAGECESVCPMKFERAQKCSNPNCKNGFIYDSFGKKYGCAYCKCTDKSGEQKELYCQCSKFTDTKDSGVCDMCGKNPSPASEQG